MKLRISITLFLFLALVSLTLSASVHPVKQHDKEQGRSMARIDATLKSYLGNPLTGLVYAASLAIGAISILAMYESPLSPLPVPSLPKPPVGRFPPEHASWPPIPKNPMKLKSAGLPYAASHVNPVYAMAPTYPDQKNTIEENNWLGAQNMVSSYTGPMSPPRRSDQVHAAQLHSYITHMQKLPVIRSKSTPELTASSTTVSPAPHAPAVMSSDLAAAPLVPNTSSNNNNNQDSV